MKFIMSYVVAFSLIGMAGMAAPTTKATAKKPTAKAAKSAQKKLSKKTKKRAKKKNVRRSQTARAKTLARTTSLPTRSETADPSVSAASLRPASQATRASITKAVQEATPRKFKLLLDSWNEMSVGDTNRGNSAATAINLVRPSYLLSDVSSVAVGVEFMNSWGTVQDNESKFQFLDPYLQYAHSNIVDMKFAKITGAFRYYVPVSEGSMDEDKGRFGRFRANMELIGKISPAVAVGYHLSPRYDFRKNLSYFNQKDNEYVPTLQLTVVHFGFVRADLGKKFSFYQNLGFVNQQWNEDNGLAKDSVANFYAETGLGYDFTKNVSLIAGVFTDSKDTFTGQKKFNEGIGFYNENDSLYFLEGVVSF